MTYSAFVFANRTIDIINSHPNTSEPLFIYLPMQSIHEPIQVPDEYLAPYAYLKDKNRRGMAGMATCLDSQLERIAAALQARGMWDDTIVVFVADK